MPKNKSYTEHLIELKADISSIKTTQAYQENHLRNIDQHMNKQNEKVNKHGRAIAKIYGVGGAVIFIIAVVEVLIRI